MCFFSAIQYQLEQVQFVKERKKKDVGRYKAKNEHWKLVCSGRLYTP